MASGYPIGHYSIKCLLNEMHNVLSIYFDYHQEKRDSKLFSKSKKPLEIKKLSVRKQLCLGNVRDSSTNYFGHFVSFCLKDKIVSPEEENDICNSHGVSLRYCHVHFNLPFEYVRNAFGNK